jgi:hypothetical protein
MAIRNWMLEALVAKKIGVAGGVIAAYRKYSLEKNRDWHLDQNQVELSAALPWPMVKP